MAGTANDKTMTVAATGIILTILIEITFFMDFGVASITD
jgi:hypothetical protein